MPTQFVNFHFSAFKFIQLLPNGSLEEREARGCAEEADSSPSILFLKMSGNLFNKVRQVRKVDSRHWEKQSHPEILFKKWKC